MSTQRKTYKNHSKRFNNTSSSSNSNNTSSQLTSLVEMFPDWEADELQSLLIEHKNSLEIVIDLIVNNKVSKWEPIKKESKHKKKEKEKEPEEVSVTPAPAAPSSSEQPKFNKYNNNPANSKPKFRSQSSYKKTSNQPQKKTPASENTSSASTSSTSSAVPAVNSWAAALSKDKPKQKPVEKEIKPVEEPVREPQPAIQPEEEEAPETVVEEPIFSEENGDSKPVLKQAPIPQPKQGSWVSAIAAKPKKANPKTQSNVSSKSTDDTNEQIEAMHQQADVDIGLNQTEGSVPVTIMDSKSHVAYTEPELNNTQLPPQVVLPASSQHVNSVGVSFGSLSLGDEEKEVVSEKPDDAAVEQQQAQQSQAQLYQQQQRYGLYNNQNKYNQEAYQQQYGQTKQQQQQQSQPPQSSQPSQQQQQQQQQYDYYNQFQQGQQFPQQNVQSLPGAQYGAYPGLDYSAYNPQVAAVASPAAAQASIASYGQYGQPVSQPQSTGVQESNQSPVVNSNSLQQQVPATPFGYPYYNYYYNTPFYGNGASLGGQAGFGTAQTAQSTSQVAQPAAHTTPQASTTGAINGYAGGVSAGSSQYYGQPNQFGNRYPGYNSYPQPQPQQGQSQPNSSSASNGEASDATVAASQAAGQQQAQVPGQQTAQFPGVMPQYAGYQYPQYGGYQDSNQYRGWY